MGDCGDDNKLNVLNSKLNDTCISGVKYLCLKNNIIVRHFHDPFCMTPNYEEVLQRQSCNENKTLIQCNENPPQLGFTYSLHKKACTIKPIELTTLRFNTCISGVIFTPIPQSKEIELNKYMDTTCTGSPIHTEKLKIDCTYNNKTETYEKLSFDQF